MKSNAAGFNGITRQMLGMVYPVISPIISHIFNSCLEIGYFPEQWKTVPQKSNSATYDELRSTSLLPILLKIVERVAYIQLYEYLISKNIIPTQQ